MKKIILFLLLMLPLNIYALSYGGCNYAEVSKMKESVKNINVSYDYYIENNIAYFNVTLVNLVPDIYFHDRFQDKIYTYSDSINGEIVIGNYTESGYYNFYSNNSNCPGLKLGTVYYNLPTYNPYYLDPLCKKMADYKLCKKWQKLNYSYEEFEKILLDKQTVTEEETPKPEYEDTFLEKILNLYAKYYYFFLLGVIGICIIILYIKKYQNRL